MDLEKIFDINLQSRKILERILKDTRREELLKIPLGYKNNIWWNIAHVVVSQQILVYKMSNLQMRVPDLLVDKFKKGTVPDGTASEQEINSIRSLLFATIAATKEDYETGRFREYGEYTTSANVTLKSVEDAMAFNNYHEGLHMGMILALQKMV